MLFQQLLFAKHLERSEKILFTIHRHWFFLKKTGLIVGFFGLIIPWTLYAIGFNTPFYFWIAVIWSATAYFVFMWELFKWYGNAILMTSTGLLKVEWDGPFNNTAMRVSYDDVEGATYVIKGFWGTVLRYGQFTLRLFGGTHFVIEKAYKPAKAETRVMELRDSHMQKKRMTDAEGLKQMLVELASRQLKK